MQTNSTRNLVDSIPGPARLQAFARRLTFLTIRLPELTVTASPEEAEVILVYGAADPGNQVMFGLTHKNEWGKGFVIRVTADGRKRVLISFEDTATTIYERSPTGNFARAFVKAYKAANKK